MYFSLIFCEHVDVVGGFAWTESRSYFGEMLLKVGLTFKAYSFCKNISIYIYIKESPNIYVLKYKM